MANKKKNKNTRIKHTKNILIIVSTIVILITLNHYNLLWLSILILSVLAVLCLILKGCNNLLTGFLESKNKYNIRMNRYPKYTSVDKGNTAYEVLCRLTRSLVALIFIITTILLLYNNFGDGQSLILFLNNYVVVMGASIIIFLVYKIFV